MSTSAAANQTSPSGTPLSPAAEATDAVQRALAAEHAAFWAYGLADAYLDEQHDEALAEGRTEHRRRRDEVEALLAVGGTDPVPAEPSYQTPEPVVDARSALVLVLTAETDAAAAWRYVLERSADGELRAAAFAALVDAARRAVRWRQELGVDPVTVAFPGRD
ncbi:ferritin-like domain-containing protein [Actinoalloteichus spitiensis]|uniref:ferritin-like domain-containing protein n=1 Tax=Actinoalloteichus spitiensis TaxID=252394 RepID=UPI00035F2852|nr:ferritin-like domain-containing protein [Actinoalloteichus spitiensis]